MKRNSYQMLTGKTKSNGHQLWGDRERREEENGNAPKSDVHYMEIFQDREGAGGMRVGRDYQAKIPMIIPREEQNPMAENDKALLVWCPSERITDDELDQYLNVARDKFQYSGEQALGLLFWHRYDVKKSLHDLGNFTPHPEEWTVEDKVLFEQAIQYHGKAFDRIRQMKPNGDSGKKCGNCGVPSTELHTKDSLCNTCYLFWKKSGEVRPLTGPLKRGERPLFGIGIVRQRRGPPRGIHINHEDLEMLAAAPPQADNVTLYALEKEIQDMKCRVQINKQGIEILKRGIPEDEGIKIKPKETAITAPNRTNSRWTHEELMLASQGVRRYGKNFKLISEVIGTKTEAHLKTFYTTNRKKYELDKLVEEFNHENS